jgi:hypothetical protein
VENFISTKIKAKIVEHEFFRSDFSSEMLAIAFHLMPSFLPYSQIRILANQNTIEAEIDIGDSIKESLKLDSTKILNNLLEFELMKLKDYKRLGLDGITVYCLCKHKNEINFFEYWSPDITSVYNKLSLFIFSFLYENFKSNQIQEYLEHLNDYIGFMLPFKCEEFEDYESIRIFGSLSWQFPFETDYPLQKKIEDSINNFSSTKPILLDLSNFNSMGSLYADIFNRFFSKYEYIVILMNTNAIETFKGMGFEGEFFVEREKALAQLKKIL